MKKPILLSAILVSGALAFGCDNPPETPKANTNSNINSPVNRATPVTNEKLTDEKTNSNQIKEDNRAGDRRDPEKTAENPGHEAERPPKDKISDIKHP